MKEIADILKKIIERKKEVVRLRKSIVSHDFLYAQISKCGQVRGFVAAVEQKKAQGQSAVIAEIKKASPSKGVICKDFNPEVIAAQYEEAGAVCLSVLTEEDFFQGHDDYLKSAKKACHLPVLRKDFIIDEYQIVESRVMGADCILLIVAALSFSELKHFYELALRIGLDVLIEVHDEEELRQALQLNPTLIGINNRDLKTFNVTLETTFNLLKFIPEKTIVVSESGILDKKSVNDLKDKNVNAFLVGEAFMKTAHPGLALKTLFF